MDCCHAENTICNIFDVLKENSSSSASPSPSATSFSPTSSPQLKHVPGSTRALRIFPTSHTPPWTQLNDSDPYEFEFEIDKGHERIHYFHTSSPHPSVPVFYGYCYYCDCPKHSQNYCPLKFCQFCEEYGHSIKVCPRNSAQGNNDWRKKSQPGYGHFKYWKHTPFRKRDRLFEKIPFGSTWNYNKNKSAALRQDWRTNHNIPTPSKWTLDDTDTVPCGILMELPS